MKGAGVLSDVDVTRISDERTAVPTSGAPSGPATGPAVVGPGRQPSMRTRRRRTEPPRYDLETAEVIAVAEDGTAVVRVHEGDDVRVMKPRSLVELRTGDVGRRAIVQYERGDPARPVLLGLLRDSDPAVLGPTGARMAVPGRVVIEARDEVVLRCGGASIALGPRGKVAIKGDHVVSRSTGVNRVNGASVQIN